MNKELVKVEEGQLIIAKEVVNKIKELEKKKKQLDEIQKTYKEKILEVMENNNIKSFETNDKTLKITRTEGGITSIFDSSRFSKEHHDLYVEYLKDSTMKSSLRITVRENENE